MGAMTVVIAWFTFFEETIVIWCNNVNTIIHFARPVVLIFDAGVKHGDTQVRVIYGVHGERHDIYPPFILAKVLI